MEPGEIVGFVGGTIGILKSVWDGYQWWRSRGKIETRMLRLAYYVDRFGPGTRPRYPFPTEPGISMSILDGKSKNAFTIMELEISNTYRQAMTVGRIEIDDWIYSDRYHPHMYDRFRDYRVFNLYTREPQSLATYCILEPGHKIGRRIEIIEYSDGPNWVSNHRYIGIPERREFVVRIQYTNGMVSQTFPVDTATEEFPAWSCDGTDSMNLYNFSRLPRWSGQELIPGGVPDSGGEPKP